MYGNSLSSVQYDDGTETWVNTGILSATSAVGKNNIIGVDNFIEQSVSAYSVKGYLRTQKPNSETISAIAPAWNGQRSQINTVICQQSGYFGQETCLIFYKNGNLFYTHGLPP